MHACMQITNTVVFVKKLDAELPRLSINITINTYLLLLENKEEYR